MQGFTLFCESKFFVGPAMTCIGCHSNLVGYQIAKNPKHVYDLGILYDCKCTSKVWANSVRNPEALLSYLTGQANDYRSGFCNDPFCGYCFGYLQPIKNGFEYKGSRKYDLYGCKECQQNQKVAVDGSHKLPEGPQATEYFIQWYKRHLDELQKGVA